VVTVVMFVSLTSRLLTSSVIMARTVANTCRHEPQRYQWSRGA
jgi:hypothetical protein